MSVEKRFTTKEQIIAAIDKTILKSQRYLKKAAEADALADELFKKGERIPEAKDLREIAEYKRKVGLSLLHSTAKKLGDKLSEFMTQPMPLLEDGSVSASLRKKAGPWL